MKAAAIILFALGVASYASGASLSGVDDIVKKSVANTEAGWKLAPQYSYIEHDLITRHGKKTDITYRVMMIEGSPYNQVVARNGQPLSPAEDGQERAKLQEETERRQHESPAARQARIEKYTRERNQDHALLREMVNAFDYRMDGQQEVGGRQCYVLQASPRPGYRPVSRETKVLTGMRGTMWIDTTSLQWVKVHAEVFRPVAFGLFIAHVQPGTEFTLEDAPIASNVWLPVHFKTVVKASVLLWERNSVDDETYSNYRQGNGALLDTAEKEHELDH